jgi:hypothetical protein
MSVYGLPTVPITSGTSVNGVLQNPLNYVRGGYYSPNNGEVNYYGRRLFYWANTGLNASNARSFVVAPTYYYSYGEDPKVYGMYIRCVAV